MPLKAGKKSIGNNIREREKEMNEPISSENKAEEGVKKVSDAIERAIQIRCGQHLNSKKEDESDEEKSNQ